MKTHISFPILALVVSLLAAMATGSGVFWGLAILIALVLLCALVTVNWTASSMRVRTDFPAQRVVRGDSLSLPVYVTVTCPLPLATVEMVFDTAPGLPENVYTLYAVKGMHAFDISCQARHVGACTPGLKESTVHDLFQLFERRPQPDQRLTSLLVLPLTFDVEPLHFAPVESTMGTMALATEDLTDPADIRAYQQGDPMKRIHWKLSARKQELVVRRFEEPVLPESLILLDCGQPPAPRGSELDFALRDALLETAASVLQAEAKQGRTVRLPLHGSHPVEVTGSMGLRAMEEIARVDFSETSQFEQVLRMESQRLRAVGATVVVTARLSGAVVDTMVRMRRLGPAMRLLLVTPNPDDQNWLPYIDRLQQHDIEVGYVRTLDA